MQRRSSRVNQNLGSLSHLFKFLHHPCLLSGCLRCGLARRCSCGGVGRGIFVACFRQGVWSRCYQPHGGRNWRSSQLRLLRLDSGQLPLPKVPEGSGTRQGKQNQVLAEAQASPVLLQGARQGSCRLRGVGPVHLGALFRVVHGFVGLWVMAANFYLGQFYLGQCLLRPILLGPSSTQANLFFGFGVNVCVCVFVFACVSVLPSSPFVDLPPPPQPLS